jgi:hypothetical protein
MTYSGKNYIYGQKLLHTVNGCPAIPGKRWLWKCKRHSAMKFKLTIMYAPQKEAASRPCIIVNSTAIKANCEFLHI